MSQELVNSVNALTGKTTALLGEYVEAKTTIDGKVAVAKQQANVAKQQANAAAASALAAKNDATRAETAAASATAISEINTVHDAVALALAEGQVRMRSGADMEAMRQQNPERYAASGFVHMGNHYLTNNVNEGLSVRPSVSSENTLFIGRRKGTPGIAGTSASDVAVIHMGGFITKLDLGAADGFDGLYPFLIKFPESEAGTRVYDRETGESIDYRYDVSPQHGRVADTLNQAVTWAFLGEGGKAPDVPQSIASYNAETGEGTLQGLFPKGTKINWSLDTRVVGKGGWEFIVEVDNTASLNSRVMFRLTNDASTSPIAFYNVGAGEKALVHLKGEVTSDDAFRAYIEPQEGELNCRFKVIRLSRCNKEVVTQRVDFAALEGFLERVTPENPYIYPNGCIQTQAIDIEGIATGDSNRPDSYYAVFDGDESSRGKGVNYFTLSVLEQDLIAGNPDHNLFNLGLDKDGKPIICQWRVRQKTFSGAGNGDWFSTTPAGVNGGSLGRFLSYQNGVAIVQAQGARDSSAFLDASPSNAFSGVDRSSAITLNSKNLHKGVWTVENTSSSLAYDGLCFLLPICTASRLNNGCYHPKFNPAGAASLAWKDAIAGQVHWYRKESAYKNPTKITDCFILADAGGSKSTVLDNGGISNDFAARPDKRKHNCIYADGLGGVVDLRPKYGAWDASSAEQASVVRSEVENGKYRGKEKLKFTKPLVIDGSTDNANSGRKWQYDPTERRLRVYSSSLTDAKNGDTLTVYAVDADFIVSGTVVANFNFTDILNIKVQKQGTLPDSGTWTYVDANPENVFAFLSQDVDITVSGAFLQSDVIGDPANILQCYALIDGWFGDWIPVIPDGTTQTFQLTRKNLDPQVSYAYTDNLGETWGNTTSSTFDAVNNGFVTHWSANRIQVMQYIAFAKQTKSCDNQSVLHGRAGVTDVFVVQDYNVSEGALLTETLIGKVPTGNVWNGRNQHLSLESMRFGSSEQKLSTASGQQSHAPITLATTGSAAVKSLAYQTEVDDQASLAFVFNELKNNGTSWGDSSKVVIADNSSTYTNDNGEACLCGTAELAIPYGYIKNTH